jgi:large-conductance mechanosensitive channel
MGPDGTLMTFAVAIYIGVALSNFFGAITRDLVTPVVAGLFPGAEKSLGKVVVNVAGIKLEVGDAIAATMNLMIAYLVVSMTLPYIRMYAPLSGGKSR